MTTGPRRASECDAALAPLEETDWSGRSPGPGRHRCRPSPWYLAGEYHRLYSWVSDTTADLDEATASAATRRAVDNRAIVADAGDSGLQRELAQLLMYHCQVLHYALRLAFPKYRAPIGDEHRRAICLDLGEPAQRLHDLAEQLREQP